jgi:hypothetical protein
MGKRAARFPGSLPASFNVEGQTVDRPFFGWGCGRVARLVLFSLALLPAPAAYAEPMDADLNNWQSPCYNCYNYATNLKTAFFAQPGGQVDTFTCDAVTKLAKFDGLMPVTTWKPGDPPPMCPADSCLVALAIDPGPKDPDFHWYRLNQDGTWSEKPGQTPARIFQNNGMNVTDPSTADRGDYTLFCGYFCVPKDPMPTLKGGIPWQQGGDGADWIDLADCGRPNPQGPVNNLSPILAALPTGPPIANPNWGDPSLTPNHNGGLALLPHSGAGFPAAYYRVFQGVVAEYSDLNGTTITYFADNNNLNGALEACLPEPSSVTLLGLGVVGLAGLRWRRRAA